METVKTAESGEGQVAHPPIVGREEWLRKRKELLAHEKALTEQYDRVNAQRRRLPMVKVEKDYVFDTPEGTRRLVDLFEGRRQLIVYHFMFDPSWEKGCPGCTGLVNALGDLSMLEKRNTTLVLVSQAPLAKLEQYKASQGWKRRWVSSFESDFNYDFYATLDDAVTPPEYNYRDMGEMEQKLGRAWNFKGEHHGLSVFFRIDDDVFHTYSTYGRGCEALTDSYRLLDVTPWGRQEDFEESPAGWPRKPTYGPR